MMAVVVIGVCIAWWYYKSINDSVDPRIREARNLYEGYNEFVVQSQYDSIFNLMDKIESIYNAVDHYKNSFENAVLYNNRSAAFLAMYLQPDNDAFPDKAMFIQNSENAARKSIDICENWNALYKNVDDEDIQSFINNEFFQGLDEFTISEKEKYLQTRVNDIRIAKTENNRRLSVAYTNLGMVKRYQQKYDSAAIFYKKAIELWDRNLTAENNLNILFNKPLRKRTFIQKLFPPEK
jgi:hypothetical protein